MATGSFDGEVQGLNPLQAQEQSQFGPGNYMPNVRVVYWSMRVMAYMGMLMFLVAAVGAWLYWRQKLERARWFHRTAIVAIAFPFIASTAGWLLTEMGRQPWIVQDLLKTADAHSPAVSSTMLAFSLIVFVGLYLLLLVLDIWLMRRYAKLDPPELDRDETGETPCRRSDTEMDLQDLWFCLIGFFFAAYFVLEGFDFGVGLLLPFLPRNEEERSTMFRTIGPVWDGNEVWLVIAGGSMFAAFPTWYATMFSGFYIALLLLLVFLIVRVLSFEWRERNEQSRWLGVWAWANTIGSLGAALIWGVAFSNLLYGVPINSSHDFVGTFSDLFNLYTLLGGIAVVLLFAFHGATYLTLRTTGELCRRAATAARRLSIVAAVVGSAFLIWTVAVAVDRNDKDVFPPVLPAVLAIVALLGAVVCVRLARSGWAFVLTAAGAFLVVATIFTSLYPRVMVASNDFANSLTVDNASSANYTLKV
jgi:cytochrome d ubiquinol oxidase subunit II